MRIYLTRRGEVEKVVAKMKILCVYFPFFPASC
jgi:hypothetical protein